MEERGGGGKGRNDRGEIFFKLFFRSVRGIALGDERESVCERERESH